jgi:hypothetical protein
MKQDQDFLFREVREYLEKAKNKFRVGSRVPEFRVPGLIKNSRIQNSTFNIQHFSTAISSS